MSLKELGSQELIQILWQSGKTQHTDSKGARRDRLPNLYGYPYKNCILLLPVFCDHRRVYRSYFQYFAGKTQHTDSKGARRDRLPNLYGYPYKNCPVQKLHFAPPCLLRPSPRVQILFSVFCRYFYMNLAYSCAKFIKFQKIASDGMLTFIQ